MRLLNVWNSLERRVNLLIFCQMEKTQVTVEYENNQPIRISTVVVSSQHREDVDIATLREDITSHVILPTLPQDMLDHQTQIFINPTGRFVVGGPAGDSGLTGRKLIVDSYGGYARHGGGAFSGKDATKVDRSGAYMVDILLKILWRVDWLMNVKFN